MPARFVACVACGRHVKEGDVACPFCGADAPRVGPLPRLAGVRVTRAAMIAAGTAGTVAAILDCGQTSSTAFYGVACTGSECIPGDQDAAPVVLYDGGSSAVFYGAACTGDACPGRIEEDAGSVDATVDASVDATVDASVDASAGDASDAAKDAQTDAAEASED